MHLLRKEFWSIVIATVVTGLVWIWAAGENREQGRLLVRISFVTSQPEQWVVAPSVDTVNVTIEGSRRAVRTIGGEGALSLEFMIGRDDVPSTIGTHPIDLTALLSRHERLLERGVTVVNCDPSSMQLLLDRIVTDTVEVVPQMPGVQTEGEMTVEPASVQISMPQLLRSRYPEKLRPLQAIAESWQIEPLESGRPHTIDVRVLPPDGVEGNPNVRIVPDTVRVTFTIRSQIRQVTLDSVRVQLAGPWEDHEDYIVELEPTQLRNVTISAEADLIRRINEGGIPVFAFIHVSSLEKERGIASKPISYLQAMITASDGSTSWRPVTLILPANTPRPVVNLNIRARPRPTTTPPIEQ